MMTPLTARPRGPTGTSHAHRCAGLVPVASRCAWAPPIGYGDGPTPGLNPRPNSFGECRKLDTEIGS
jgi:hypothetical protein